MANLVILNFSGGTVNYYTITKRQSKNLEGWILKHTEHRLGDIEYMYHEELTIINH